MANKKLDELKAAFMSGQYVKFTLKDVILEHPHLHEPDTRFDEVGKYKVNAIIPGDIAKDMRYIGFNVKTNKDGMDFVVVQRKPALGRPTVTKDGKEVDARTIGNGSVANIDVTAKHFNVGGKSHLPIYIEEVKIEDLIVYEGGSGETVELM